MKKILVVEDIELNRGLLEQLLEDDYEVVTADDGAAGIEMAEAMVPDLILMDLSLPIIDGWEATRRIKASDRLKDVPVIAVTAPCHAGRRGKGARGGLRRFRHQAHRRRPVARQDQRLSSLMCGQSGMRTARGRWPRGR